MCLAEFAIVDEAYPFVAKMLLTDDSPRLRSALKYMVYGKDSVFDADRLIDLLAAFEDFSVASKSARGDMDAGPPRPGSSLKLPSQPGKAQTADPWSARSMPNRHSRSQSAADIRSMSNGQASTSTAYNQNGTSSGVPRNWRPSSRPYSSSGAGRTAGAGTYASVDGYGAVPAASWQGNGYDTSTDNKPQLEGQLGSGVTASGMSNSGRPATATAMQVHSGQAKMAGSERADSRQHATTTSNGGSWGSWGRWPPQVIFCTSQMCYAGLENRLSIAVCRVHCWDNALICRCFSQLIYIGSPLCVSRYVSGVFIRVLLKFAGLLDTYVEYEVADVVLLWGICCEILSLWAVSHLYMAATISVPLEAVA